MRDEAEIVVVFIIVSYAAGSAACAVMYTGNTNAPIIDTAKPFLRFIEDSFFLDSILGEMSGAAHPEPELYLSSVKPLRRDYAKRPRRVFMPHSIVADADHYQTCVALVF